MLTLLLSLSSLASPPAERSDVRADELPEVRGDLGISFGTRLAGRFDDAPRGVATFSGAWRVADPVRIGASFSAVPDLRRRDFHTITHQQATERVGVASRVANSGTVEAVFAPLGGAVWGAAGDASGARRFDLLVGLGAGAVHTLDDLELLQCEGSAPCEQTASQWHPALSTRIGAELTLGPRWSVVTDVHRLGFVEVLQGTETVATSATTWTLGVRRTLRAREVAPQIVADAVHDDDALAATR